MESIIVGACFALVSCHRANSERSTDRVDVSGPSLALSLSLAASVSPSGAEHQRSFVNILEMHRSSSPARHVRGRHRATENPRPGSRHDTLATATAAARAAAVILSSVALIDHLHQSAERAMSLCARNERGRAVAFKSEKRLTRGRVVLKRDEIATRVAQWNARAAQWRTGTPFKCIRVAH